MLGVGAFLMQVAVQGAWGIVPVHLNELSPPWRARCSPASPTSSATSSRPQRAFQAGIAESRGDNYGLALALFGAVAAVVIIGWTAVGPERKNALLARKRTSGSADMRCRVEDPRNGKLQRSRPPGPLEGDRRSRRRACGSRGDHRRRATRPHRRPGRRPVENFRHQHSAAASTTPAAARAQAKKGPKTRRRAGQESRAVASRRAEAASSPTVADPRRDSRRNRQFAQFGRGAAGTGSGAGGSGNGAGGGGPDLSRFTPARLIRNLPGRLSVDCRRPPAERARDGLAEGRTDGMPSSCQICGRAAI